MNAETVGQWLAAIGVPAEVVSIGTEIDDAWCLVRRDPANIDPADIDRAGIDRAGTGGSYPDGDDGSRRDPEWEVFWREQGNRYDWARFSNEHVACCYLFGRLAWTQVASGIVTPRDGAR